MNTVCFDSIKFCFSGLDFLSVNMSGSSEKGQILPPENKRLTADAKQVKGMALTLEIADLVWDGPFG
ncbi:MAG: hypothetical protein R2861_05325 [Desulfobacterales bacterium]